MTWPEVPQMFLGESPFAAGWGRYLTALTPTRASANASPNGGHDLGSRRSTRKHLAAVSLLTTHVDKAVAIDRYDIAKALSEVMLSCARKSKDSPLIKQITFQSKMVREIASEFAKIKEALRKQ